MSIASTSRIGRKPVVIPAGVEVKLSENEMSVKGPKGKLSIKLHPFVKIDYKNNEINVHSSDMTGQVITGSGKKLYKSITGTIRANIMNAVHGVTQGNERKLTLVGVGYKAQSKGKILSLSLGYSHPTDFDVPEGVTIETPTQTEIIIKGASDELVGEVAAKIRAKRKPEPYKGKGIRYADEIIEIKETKKK
jgi:large subunit ribosomal protein L6